jgi:hypothetical protein
MKVFLIAGAVAALAGVSARAETVNLQYMGTGNGRMVRASVSTQTFNVFAGRLKHNAHWAGGSNSSVVTFSTDLFQAASTSMTPFIKTTVAQLSGNAGTTNLGMAKMQAVHNIFAAANHRQFTLGHDYATAFQVALWEIVYDYNPASPNFGLNIGNGTFRAAQVDGSLLSASIREKIAALFSAVGTNASGQGVLGFRSAGFGDQITVVPLPPGAWLAAGGLGLAALRRRFCRD